MRVMTNLNKLKKNKKLFLQIKKLMSNYNKNNNKKKKKKINILEN